MSVTSRPVRYADYTLRAVAMLCSLGALWLWVQSTFWRGDVTGFSNAMAWTVVSLAVWGLIMLAEKVTNTGE